MNNITKSLEEQKQRDNAYKRVEMQKSLDNKNISATNYFNNSPPLFKQYPPKFDNTPKYDKR